MILLPGIVDAVDSSTAEPTVRLRGQGFGTLTYGPTITPDLANGPAFVVSVTDAVAFQFLAPVYRGAAIVAGSRFPTMTIRIRNTSGGAHGAGTFAAAGYLVPAAVPAIANGNSRAFEFIFNGTLWVETFRSAADVPN